MTVLLGSGNVATWIGRKLAGSEEFAVRQVYSPDLEHAKRLAGRIGAQAVDSLADIDRNGGVYIFSLKDDAYPAVLEQLPFSPPLALHTSGAVSQQVFAGHARAYGVIYPLQTFSSAQTELPAHVTMMLETDHTGDKKDLVERLARQLADTVCHVDESGRLLFHVAAVFACNFSNAMYDIAARLLAEKGLDFNMLLPLIRHTAGKLDTLSPREAQTGPAIRGDERVMALHRAVLQHATGVKQALEIYDLMTEYIKLFFVPLQPGKED